MGQSAQHVPEQLPEGAQPSARGQRWRATGETTFEGPHQELAASYNLHLKSQRWEIGTHCDLGSVIHIWQHTSRMHTMTPIYCNLEDRQNNCILVKQLPDSCTPAFREKWTVGDRSRESLGHMMWPTWASNWFNFVLIWRSRKTSTQLMAAAGNGTGILERWSHSCDSYFQHYLLLMLKLSSVLTLCNVVSK